MAQLGSVGAERGSLEAKQETSQIALFIAAGEFHDTVERLKGRRHELARRYIQIAGLQPSTASSPAVRRVTQGPSHTVEKKFSSFVRPCLS